MVTSMSPGNSAADGSALAAKLGIKTVTVCPEEAAFSMPVEGNTQVRGILHGGATAALCEHAASRAANQHAQTLGRVAVGTELSISHVRQAPQGAVTATAKAEHLGRSRTVHRVDVTDEEGKLISVAIVTNMLLDPR